MAEEKYFTVRSTHTKSITYNVTLETDKRKKVTYTDNVSVTINGSFPRPNPALMKPGVSYLSEAEKSMLEKEPSFVQFVEDAKFVLHEIPFKDLPPELQKQYDVELYNKLKAEQA
jgi:hypothetical protein